MGSLASISNSHFFSTYNYKNKIYQPLIDNRIYSSIKIKNISFPFNIISDKTIKRCAIIIFINIGFFQESQNIKYDNYIKLFLEIIFERKNKFNELFSKYDLKYYNKIEIEKTIIYFEFDYIGFKIIFNSFIKTIINIDNLLIKNEQNKIIDDISLANNTSCSYIIYKKFIENILINNFNKNNDKKINHKELNKEEFFHYYFLKNENLNITILSPYSINKIEIILNDIFDKLRYEIKNKLIKRYEKYKEKSILNSKLFNFTEPSLLLSSKINLSNNNILKIKFLFPFLKFDNQNILEYFAYMLRGKKPGSFYYDLYKRKYVNDMNVYSVYNINTPCQLVIKFRFYYFFPIFNLTIILAKLINFLRKLKSERNLIKATYKNFQKLIFQKFVFENNNKNGIYEDLYNYTYNSILLKKKYENKNINNINILINKYNVPSFNINLIEQIINEIMLLNNLFIIIELFPKTFNPFIINPRNLQMNNIILNHNIEINEYKTNIIAKINKEEIIKYSNTTQIYDNPMFKHKQDKKNYISNENNLIPINYNINNNIQLILNNISNKLWYKFNYEIKSPKIYSSFHILHPNIRNNIYNLSLINLKYFNHIQKQIEIEFEELYDISNLNVYNDYYININNDGNGINLEINTFKDVYLKIIKKIFEFIFEFDKNFIEYTNVDYLSKIYKDELSKAIWYLNQVLKKDNEEKYFKDINSTFNLNNIKTYANEINQNMYIDGLLYGYLDFDIIKEVRNILFEYNTREYDNYCFFTDISSFKKKIYECKIIKEKNIYIFKLKQNFFEDNMCYYLSFYQINAFNKNKELFIIIIYILLKIYIPKCTVYKIFTDNIYYLLIARKSFDNPEFSAKHISINIKKFIDIIFNKSNDELKLILLDNKEVLKNEINNFNNEFNYLWREIYYDKYNFEEYENLKDIYNKYFSQKNNNINFDWLDEFKIFLKDNLFDKQKKVEFLFYNNNVRFINSQDNNNYPRNFYNDYSFNVFTYNYLLYINEEK